MKKNKLDEKYIIYWLFKNSYKSKEPCKAKDLEKLLKTLKKFLQKYLV